MYPKLIQIGPLTLYSFGFMVVLGFMSGIYLAARLARRRGLPGEALFDSAMVILVASILGARLLFVALHWKHYAGRLQDVGAVWQGGMSFHGGVGAGILTGILCMRLRKLPALALADAAAPGLALGYAIGRIGCLLNGCCFGSPTSLPWGMPFPEGTAGVHYHPAQVYAAVVNLGLTGLLIWTYGRPHRVGQNLMLFVGLYSLYRFWIEGLRSGTTARVLALGMTEAQWFSLLAILAAGAAWAWFQRKGGPAPPLAEPLRPVAVES
ncbi:MAG: prolipoprotein diacylglyceryl transferase [Armatimonadetes bacterium]|nr:prolipoprotein diacylglyceryl transferase [Armatimonadota bacterium]